MLTSEEQKMDASRARRFEVIDTAKTRSPFDHAAADADEFMDCKVAGEAM